MHLHIWRMKLKNELKTIIKANSNLLTRQNYCRKFTTWINSKIII